MQITTEALLTDLRRLESSIDRIPTANDVMRDGTHSVNTYYKRFGRQWRDVEAAYKSWQDTGELPVEAEPFDWRSLQGTAIDS